MGSKIDIIFLHLTLDIPARPLRHLLHLHHLFPSQHLNPALDEIRWQRVVPPVGTVGYFFLQSESDDVQIAFLRVRFFAALLDFGGEEGKVSLVGVGVESRVSFILGVDFLADDGPIVDAERSEGGHVIGRGLQRVSSVRPDGYHGLV